MQKAIARTTELVIVFMERGAARNRRLRRYDDGKMEARKIAYICDAFGRATARIEMPIVACPPEGASRFKCPKWRQKGNRGYFPSPSKANGRARRGSEINRQVGTRPGQGCISASINGLSGAVSGQRAVAARDLIVAPVWPIIARGQSIARGYGLPCLAAQRRGWHRLGGL